MTSIDHVVHRITQLLRTIPSIDAIVLGGSHARGSATPTSDIDIGIYYGAHTPLDLDAINVAAHHLDDAHRLQLVTAPGGWGPWVNAGGWLIIDGCHVDFILRNTQRVQEVIADCENGQISANYQPGHPHAYINAMYMGELAVCRMLWDTNGLLQALKERAMQYPAALRTALLDYFGFEADFSTTLAEKYAATDDTYYVTAHIIRAISALNQVLCAYNAQYCINEKRAVAMIETFAFHPPHYQHQVNDILTAVGHDTSRACAKLRELVVQVQALVRC